MKYISVLILPFVHKKNRDKKYLGFNFVGKRRPLAHGLPSNKKTEIKISRF